MSQAGSISGGGGGFGSFTITGNSGGAVSPTLNNINVVGSGLISIVGNPGTSTLTVSYGGTGGTQTFHTDSGDAVEAANAITIAGGSNINTVGAGSTVTVNLDNNVTISGTYTSTGGNLVLPITSNDGATQGCIFSGVDRVISFPDSQNIYIGFGAGTYPNVIGVSSNIAIGDLSMAQIAGPASGNVALGIQSLHGVINGANNNMAIGAGSLAQLQTGDNNVGIGVGSLGSMTAGNNNTGIGAGSLGDATLIGDANIALGANAGLNLTTTDSHNICLANVGVSGNNGVIRIGNDTNHTSAFMAGVYGITPAVAPQMMTVGSDGELGSQALPGEFTWNEITGTSSGILVNNGYIANNGALVTLTLPATAALGSIIEVSGKGVGGWSIAQNAGQTIHFGASNTTTGVGGSLSSTLQYDTVRMVCTTADTDFVVLSSVGNLTVV